MAIPRPFLEPKPLDPRLVTKTSLPKPRPAIALMLILWFANNKPATVTYGCEMGISGEGGIIDDGVIDAVDAYSTSHSVPLNKASIKAVLEGNPLLESQMESLNSAFELIWHLGSFSFVDAKLNRSSERTKRRRFQKIIHYSTNLDLIDILSEAEPQAFARVLVNWLADKNASGDCEIEKRLARMLCVFAEPAIYKTSKGDAGTVFFIGGVYDALLNDSAEVDIVDPGEETQGTTRILKQAISSGLFPALTIDDDTVMLAAGADNVVSYAGRIHNSLEIAHVEIDATERNDAENLSTADSIDKPHNLIFFGAPGTGKSYELSRLAEESFSEERTSRVTFYPDYTYSQFVGCFKPMTRTVKGEPEKTEITYQYVPGPFLQTCINAVAHPEQNHLLIVEEINRANPAAVFGDIFQLLDRRADGCSEYAVSVSDEMQQALEKEGLPTNKLAIPANMYIWATMNSADQGVFPMDTAFKRRWDFRYMGIDEGEDAVVGGKRLKDIVVPCGKRSVRWNDLRKAINDFMMSDDLKINEDKLLGPFFVAPSALTPERFPGVFKDKVLLYLYEDAGKPHRKKMFRKELRTYAEICAAFDEQGEGIFGNGFKDDLVFPDDEEQAEEADSAQE